MVGLKLDARNIVKSKIWIDPPSGWKYGFPKMIDKEANIKRVLLQSNYPSEDIEFAMQYMRHWPATDEEINKHC